MLFGSLVPVMIFVISIFLQSIQFVFEILEDAFLIGKLIFGMFFFAINFVLTPKVHFLSITTPFINMC